jgi:nitrogen regulatory protein PII
MEKQTVTLLTIIAESVLVEQVCKLALEAGATGYTVTDCIGSGTKGIRTGTMDMARNVRIEILARHETADIIMGQVEKRFAHNYALTLFTQMVTALAYDHLY